MAITRFRGEYFCFSNVFEREIKYRNIIFGSNEAAFQAMKSTDKKIWLTFSQLGPYKARAQGRRLKLPKHWDIIKYSFMLEIVRAKFTQHEDLRQILLSTGSEHLEEQNNWKDRDWGTVNGEGENNLGKILMRVRHELRLKISPAGLFAV